jgi:hypothetical protein
LSTESKGEAVFVRGRPKDQAPAGHVTVREAAEMYGVTEQAVRQRIKRGTLPIFTATTTTPGKELRHYIPREAVEEELKNRELQLPTEDQRGGLEAFATRLDAFAARLDAISERQERTEGKVAELVDKLARQDRIGVAQEESALRERLETEQAAREAAERERDELRMQIRRRVDPQEDPSQEVDDEPTEVFESSERIDAEPPAFDGIDGKKVKSLRDG